MISQQSSVLQVSMSGRKKRATRGDEREQRTHQLPGGSSRLRASGAPFVAPVVGPRVEELAVLHDGERGRRLQLGNHVEDKVLPVQVVELVAVRHAHRPALGVGGVESPGAQEQVGQFLGSGPRFDASVAAFVCFQTKR